MMSFKIINLKTFYSINKTKMESLICKTGRNNLIEKEDTSELEKKVGSILITLIQKAVDLAARYSASAGRDNLSSTDMIYALQYYAHEFENEDNLEESFVENEVEYAKIFQSNESDHEEEGENSESDYEENEKEEGDSESDHEEESKNEEFSRSESTEPLFVKMNEYHDNWDRWNPSETSQQVMKSAIDKVINEIDMLEIIES